MLLLNKITEFSSKNKLYHFCIIKINLMLRKITLLQYTGMCWSIIDPSTQNSPLVRSWRANVGPTKVLQLLKLSVGPMLGQYISTSKWRVANNSNHYPTLARRLLAILDISKPESNYMYSKDYKLPLMNLPSNL